MNLADEDAHPMKESLVGTDREAHRGNNAAWGAIFAGTAVFFAVVLVFGLISAAMGLSDASDVAVGIWSVVALLLALAAAGYVAGSLAVRGGLLHGLVTWATSLVGIVLLVGWLGAGILGAIGGAASSIADTVIGDPEISTTELIGQAGDDETQAEAEQAAQDARDALEQSQDDIASGAWWGVAGLIAGAVVAGAAGMAGAHTVHTQGTESRTTTRRRVDR